jgi:FkbM family methyltransferase
MIDMIDMIDIDTLDNGPMKDIGVYDHLKWEWSNQKNSYTIYLNVDEGDIVVDIGCSIGVFTKSILELNPKHCFVVDASSKMLKSAMNNLMGTQTSFHKFAIHTSNRFNGGWGNDEDDWCNAGSFVELVDILNLEKIDFLKFDCEGGEYIIFDELGTQWCKDNVSKMVGEFHLANTVSENQFKSFCENVLPQFSKYKVTSIDEIDIGWGLYDTDGKVNQSFLDYYTEVIIHIDNRK